MIVIFAIFLTTVLASSHEKYINLLPDAEKREIFDKVAKRIVEIVVSNDTNKQTENSLTNEQLNVQDSYIKSTIKQRYKRYAIPSEEDNGSKENENLDEEFEVKPLKSRNDVDELATSEKNLNVAGISHHSDESHQENFSNEAKADYATGNTLPLQNKSATYNANSEETTKAATIQNSNEEKEENYVDESLDSETKIQNTDPVKFTIVTSTLSTIYDNHSQQYKFSSEINDSQSITVTSFLQEDNNKSIETTAANNIQTLGPDSSINSNTLSTERNDEHKYLNNPVEPVLNTTESYTQDTSNTQTRFLIDESTTNSVMNMTTYENTYFLTTFNSQIFTKKTHNIAEKTTENYSAVTKHNFVEEKQSTKSPKMIKLTNNIKQSENDTSVSFIASKALNKIKQELELEKEGKFIDNDIKSTNLGDTHLNHYRVYEIPWPIKRGSQSFLRRQKLVKDQPYFVPVYKYSPNFAYYNPKNRLGPNDIKEKFTRLDTDLREGETEINDKEESRRFVLQLHNDVGITLGDGQDDDANNQSQKWGQILKLLANFSLQFIKEYLKPYLPNQSKPTAKPKKPRDSCESKSESSNCEPSDEDGDENKEQAIARLLSSTDEKYHPDILEKLNALALSSLRSKAESKISIYTNVVKDLMLEDSKSLKQYDWLTTTVRIQTALTKILKLIKRVRQSERLYPADLQILSYMLFLHNFSLEIKEVNKLRNKLRKRNKNKRKHKLLKEKEDDGLNHLYEFLINVQDGLFDLHEAIRHISDVTKFNHQNWYDNLKQLYLSADEKHLRELLLHISMSRLVELLEHSLKRGLDGDFIQFVRTNKKEAKKIVEEMLFINYIVNEIIINKS